MSHSHNRGFTLVEIAIVIAIMALLLAAVVKGQSLLRGSETQDILATAKDLSAAVQAFKERYHYLPGDFPVDQATPEIASVSTACRIGGSNAGNGNGRISDAESYCATEHLIRAGFIRGNPDATDPKDMLRSRYGLIRIIAANDPTVHVSGFPASAMNLVEMENIPCDTAMSIALKIDTGQLQTGAKVRASVATCPEGSSLYLAFAL
jgi:prepilin-type N-terminal cleavage/methylation domain-containing protein